MRNRNVFITKMENLDPWQVSLSPSSRQTPDVFRSFDSPPSTRDVIRSFVPHPSTHGCANTSFWTNFYQSSESSDSCTLGSFNTRVFVDYFWLRVAVHSPLPTPCYVLTATVAPGIYLLNEFTWQRLFTRLQSQ